MEAQEEEQEHEDDDGRDEGAGGKKKILSMKKELVFMNPVTKLCIQNTGAMVWILLTPGTIQREVHLQYLCPNSMNVTVVKCVMIRQI